MNIPTQVLSVFPNAKYVQSDDYLLEDDSIELNDALHIQVSDDGYSLIKDNGDDSFTYLETMIRSLDIIFKIAIIANKNIES